MTGDKAAVLVARRLRDRIATGHLRDGDLLPPEADLMSELGVSRPIVREALRILENERLVTVRRGALGGARVDRPSHAVVARYASLILMMDGASIEDVFDARTVLELDAVRSLAATVDTESVRRLRVLIEDEAAAIDDNDAFGAAYDRFNEALVELCPNPAIKLLWHTLDEIVSRHRQHFTARHPGDSSEVAAAGVRAHRQTIRFIVAGDGTRAQQAWGRHRCASKAFLLADTSLRRVVDVLN